MHYKKVLPIALVASTLAATVFIYKPFAVEATLNCVTDGSVSSFAQQRVNKAATDVQTTLRVPEFANQADLIKKSIDNTSLKTGGKIRDIYVGGANASDKQGMVEEYLRTQLKNPENKVQSILENKGDVLLSTINRDLNQFLAEKDGFQGSGSASRGLSTVTTTNTRNGSFKLQQRGTFGLSEDVGRFNYTVTSRVSVSVQNIRFQQKYNLCQNANQIIDGSYQAKVVLTPYLDVSYQFSHLGGSRSNKYRTFSGHFTIVDSNYRVEREINGYHP